ncbi:hypothetical protein ES703_57995 [subsurface metagenome]
MGATAMFAKNIVETNYNTLPSDVIEPTKKQILDTLAVTIAGGHLGNVSPIVDLIKEWGGKGESTILGYPHGGQILKTMGGAQSPWYLSFPCRAHHIKY